MSQTEHVKELIEELERERAKARQATSVMLLLLMAMLSTFSLVVFSNFRTYDIRSIENSVAASTSARVWPVIARQIEELATTTVPEMLQQMSNVSPNLLPNIDAIVSRESTLLERSNNSALATIVSTAFLAAENERNNEIIEWRDSLAVNGYEAELIADDVAIHSQVWAQEKIEGLFADRKSPMEQMLVENRNGDEYSYERSLSIYMGVILSTIETGQ
jgi:hypothetical protein